MGINRDGSISHLINGKEVREHRLVFEQHYNCCLLPRTAIRHKNGINWDNRIENLEPWNKRGRSAHLGRWAEPIPPDRRCMKCFSSKTRIEEDGRHHWYKRPGGYLCDRCHSKEWRRKHTKAHRHAYEKHYKCCLQPWAEIRHKNGIKTDNCIKNLEVLRKGGCAMLVTPRVPADRQCMICHSLKTSSNTYPKTGHRAPNWVKRDGGYICANCLTNELRADRKRAAAIDEDLRINEMLKRMHFDPNFMSRPGAGPRKCARCGSSITTKRSRKKGGGPDWYTYGDKLDNLWQCKRCYDNQNKKPGKAAGLLMAWRKALKGVVVDPESYEQGEGLRMDKKNALKRVKRRALKESMRRYVAPPQAPKRCAECGSITTSKSVKGADNWYRLEVPTGPIGYLDNNCYRKRQRRLKAKAKANELLY